MSPQAIIALTSALIGLAACTDKEIDQAIASLKGDQIKLDQLNQEQSSQIATLLAQRSSSQASSEVSSIAATPVSSSSSSSSSIAASQVSSVAAVPEPPKEPCTTGAFRLYDCIDGWRVYW